METRMAPAGTDEECKREHAHLTDNLNDMLMSFQDHAYARGMLAMKEACIAKVNEIGKDWQKTDERKATAAIYVSAQLGELKVQ